jgi:two-component system LytT family sensor kinase
VASSELYFGIDEPAPVTRPRRRYFLWALILAVWVMIGLTWTLNYYFFADHYVAIFSVPPTLNQMLIWELPYWLIWAALSPLIFRLAGRFPLERGKWLGNLLVHISGCIILSILHRGIYLTVGWLSQVTAYERLSSIYRVYHFLFFFNLPNGFMSYGTILLVSYLVLYYQRYQEQELKNSRLATRMAQIQLQATSAELKALKMQLHPHFLFNTLNSISALLEDNPRAADEMLCKLGDLLRRTIETSGEQTVTLEEELEYLRCYLDIERVRFEDRLVVEMQIAPDTLKAIVPNFILQPIVENAIKHAVAPARGSGRIELRAEVSNGVLKINIIDNGPAPVLSPAPAAGFREGLGLSNTRARLSQMYGSTHQFNLAPVPEGGLLVNIEIPFVRAAEPGSQGPEHVGI